LPGIPSRSLGCPVPELFVRHMRHPGAIPWSHYSLRYQRIRAILPIYAAARGGSTATITDARAGQEGPAIDLADAGPLAGRPGARKGFLFVQPCWSMGPPEEEKGKKKRRKRREEEEEDGEDELLALGIIYPWDDD